MNLLKRTAALVAVPLLLGIAGCNKSPSDAMITSRVKMAIASDAGLQGTSSRLPPESWRAPGKGRPAKNHAHSEQTDCSINWEQVDL